jgi:3-deoxy-D-manno-octulosonic-acid transferase
MRLRLTLLFYNLLVLPLLLPVLVCVMLVERVRRAGSRASFRERWGWYSQEVKRKLADGQGRALWLNASSVGEVNVALKLIAELRRREPLRPLVLSVNTSTGRALADGPAAPGLTVIAAPFDVPFLAGAIVRRIGPVAYVPVENELWPNVLRALQKQRVPAVLANARLSPRSERRYRRLRALIAPVFGMTSRVLVQEPQDVARWASLGVPAGRIRCTGSIKYDQGGGVHDGRVAAFRQLRDHLWGGAPPLLMAASTHDGEEQAIAAVYKELRGEFPALRLAVVPRHVERCGAVQQEIEALGLRVARRSAGAAAEAGAEVLLIDSTGELRDWQSLASVVVIGRSFLATGGQNPAEAIAAGVPVITGPHMENFQPLMELLRRADGIVSVDSLDALATRLRGFLRAPEEARAMAARGQAALEAHRGATERTAEEIAEMLAEGNG